MSTTPISHQPDQPALHPSVLSTIRSQSLPAQWWDLFLMELTNWRWSWRLTMIAGALMPLFFLIMLGLFAAGSDHNTLAHLLTGNMVIGLLFGTLTRIVNRVEFLRFGGGLDFFATLPVRRFLFVLAMIASFSIFSLPAMGLTLILGALWLELPLQLHPLLVIVIPLCTIPLAAVGVILGLWGRSWGEASSWSFVVSLIFSLLGPVMAPTDRLPALLVHLGYLSPATYAASALRQATLGPVTGWLLVDLAILLAMSAGLLWWIEQRMQWREG